MILSDGTCIPSYLGITNPSIPEPSEQYNNFGLKMGMVTEIFFPTDEGNISKKFIEYQVEVQYRDNNGRPITTQIARAQHADAFGGMADSLRWTFRKARGKTEDGIGVGSKVLILAINGELNNSVIIGGIRDHQGDEDKKSDGHNLTFRFNGISVIINQNGELNIARLGPTNERGVAQNTGETQTFFSFDRNGSIVFQHDDESFKLNFPSKNWELVCSNEFSVLARSKVEIFTQNLGAEILLGSSGHIILTTPAGVLVGGEFAADSLIKGTTYRVAETAMHSIQVASLGTLSAQIAVAGTALTTAAPFMLLPIVGPMLASPFIATAGIAFAAAVAPLTALITSITTFEGGALSFLSINKTT